MAANSFFSGGRPEVLLPCLRGAYCLFLGSPRKCLLCSIFQPHTVPIELNALSRVAMCGFGVENCSSIFFRLFGQKKRSSPRPTLLSLLSVFFFFRRRAHRRRRALAPPSLSHTQKHTQTHSLPRSPVARARWARAWTPSMSGRFALCSSCRTTGAAQTATRW